MLNRFPGRFLEDGRLDVLELDDRKWMMHLTFHSESLMSDYADFKAHCDTCLQTPSLPTWTVSPVGCKLNSLTYSTKLKFRGTGKMRQDVSGGGGKSFCSIRKKKTSFVPRAVQGFQPFYAPFWKHVYV